MGSCYSKQQTGKVAQEENVVSNTFANEIEKWNQRREDVLKNIDGLSELYMGMDTRNERIKLIEQNIEIFKEFFNLPNIQNGIFEQIEHMFQAGLKRYIKPPK